MGRKRTQTPAYEVVEQVLPFLEDGVKFPTLYMPLREDLFSATREIVYKELRRKGHGGKVVITYQNGNLCIGRKQLNREQQLVSMIRKLMLGCENEKLYDEALELVKVE